MAFAAAIVALSGFLGFWTGYGLSAWNELHRASRLIDNQRKARRWKRR